MTAGIKWDEFSYAYTDPLNDAATMENSHDWVEYILSLPMEHISQELNLYITAALLFSYRISYKKPPRCKPRNMQKSIFLSQ